MNIAGSCVIVAGGASGLGEATCRLLTEAGAKVTIADVDIGRGEKLATEIGAAFVDTDVCKADDVANAVRVAKDLGPLRIAVNCAGVVVAERTIRRDGVPHRLDSFLRAVNVNLVGSFNVLRFAAAAISECPPNDSGERGVIINTASIAAFEGPSRGVAYAASKAGVIGMTLPAARDLADFGIRVCTIAPGIFDTPLAASTQPQYREELVRQVAHPKRYGRSEEFALLIKAICENGYLNGETIRLDAGLRHPPT